MELSIFSAQVISLLYIATGIATFVNKNFLKNMLEDFAKSPALSFVTGFITIVLGMLIVFYHNIWRNDWTVLITLMGWLTLIKGVIVLVFPKYISWFRNLSLNSPVWAIMLLVFGIVFGYFGFVM